MSFGQFLTNYMIWLNSSKNIIFFQNLHIFSIDLKKYYEKLVRLDTIENGKTGILFLFNWWYLIHFFNLKVSKIFQNDRKMSKSSLTHIIRWKFCNLLIRNLNMRCDNFLSKTNILSIHFKDIFSENNFLQ